jgi:hypothetical protein
MKELISVEIKTTIRKIKTKWTVDLGEAFKIAETFVYEIPEDAFDIRKKKSNNDFEKFYDNEGI